MLPTKPPRVDCPNKVCLEAPFFGADEDDAAGAPLEEVVGDCEAVLDGDEELDEPVLDEPGLVEVEVLEVAELGEADFEVDEGAALLLLDENGSVSPVTPAFWH